MPDTNKQVNLTLKIENVYVLQMYSNAEITYRRICMDKLDSG